MIPHRIYLVKYSQQILMSIFEMSHFNHVLFLITVNILIPGYNLPVIAIFHNVTILYLNYYVNYHCILFKITLYIICCSLLYILSIQDNNPTLPIYILFSSQLYSILHCILFTVLYYMYSIPCKSDCFYL